MGTLILGGWIVVGLMVAGFERRPSDADPKFVTQLCVVGAIAGGFAGQVLRWYVFGEPLGFVFAAAGAELLLRSYRRRTPGRDLLIVVGRRTAALGHPPIGATWGDTALVLEGMNRRWRCAVHGILHDVTGDTLRLSDCFAELPIAVLLAE